VACGSSAVMERLDCTARSYRRFRCRECGKQYNERSGSPLNQTQYPSDVIAFVVLWRLRYRLTLCDLAEMFLQREIVFSHEAIREWEAKLAPVLADELRRCRHDLPPEAGSPPSIRRSVRRTALLIRLIRVELRQLRHHDAVVSDLALLPAKTRNERDQGPGGCCCSSDRCFCQDTNQCQ
jgi:hypothetical protein